MTEFVEQVKVKASGTERIEYIIYYVLGTIELILAFRLILKLLGASTGSGFVRAIYGVSSIFVLPFQGIFRTAVAQGVETVAIFEPATLVAIIVYSIAAWGLVKLIRISSGETQPE
ncbi:MAG: YggT family protein [Microgenomates group bacterium]